MNVFTIFSLLNPSTLWRILVTICGYILFLVRGTCVALGDFWVLYARKGKVYQRSRSRAPSMIRGDLVMQLSAQSPTHSRLCMKDEDLHLNESFIDRSLWKGLSEPSAAPSVIITGVSYGGIGFYTALHVMLSGANVHGIVRSEAKGEEMQRMIQAAVDRQCRVHKDWPGTGKIGRVMLHICDMSDTVAVSHLADKLASDPNLRVIVCNAGPMCAPLKLSPQHLEEQFATHHVGHSLLVLRLLQHRLTAAAKLSSPPGAEDVQKTSGSAHSRSRRKKSGESGDKVDRAAASQQRHAGAQPPRWRIIITSSAAAATASPTDTTTFRCWNSVDEAWWHISRFSGYGNAKMCELLFAFALARHVMADRQLAPYCTVNVLHPGPIRSRVIPNSKLPFQWLTDGEMAALFRMSPVIASLYVTDLCLSKRHDQTTGHFFRMGEDQTEYYASMFANPAERCGLFRNSALWPGIPGPRVALSEKRQEWLWNATLNYLDDHGLIDASVFRY